VSRVDTGASSHEGVPADDLDVGDVVTFRRVWHPDEDLVVAVVVTDTPRGPLLDGPDFTTPDAARSGVVEDVLDYDDLLGLDATGHYHTFSRNAGRLDVRTATDIEHRQTIAETSFGAWIQHVDDVRGWDELASRFDHVLEGGDEA
jgi:hypothetical protein